MSGARIALEGSEPREEPGSTWKPGSMADPINVTVVLRRSPSAQDTLQTGKQLPRDEAEKLLSADPHDVAAVEAFAQENGLQVVQEDLNARTIHLEGSADRIEKAFGVTLGTRTAPGGGTYRSYEGIIQIPEGLRGIVTAVLGLDTRPIAATR